MNSGILIIMMTKEEINASILGSIAGWLDLFNAELSPKRYWRGPKSQETGELDKEIMPNATLSPPE